jgi:hypothetical protein
LQALVDRDNPASRHDFAGKLACQMARTTPHIKTDFAWASRDGCTETLSLVHDLRS